MKKIATVLALGFSLAGCANAASVKTQAMTEGTERAFDSSYEDVVRAVTDGLAQLKLTPSEQQDVPEGRMILVARPPHGFSWGEVGRILVVRSESKPTQVRVVYEKRMALQWAGSQSSFARNLFAKMDAVLGKPSPDKAKP
ncbi:MAG TPA: hypothetical protein VK196_10015 [Magnetospirillum sp.]|nr:hypothetical protein [Magnetospirillum sp.]